MRAQILRTFATTTLLAASLVPLAGVAGAAPTPPATCMGQRATIVGAPGRGLTGTDGRDVIVTRGSGFVDARGGDDLVCITRGSARVLAGGGNDTVRNHYRGKARPWIELGQGDDTFLGSSGPEQVWGGVMDDARSLDSGRDVIRTRGGDDLVHTGNSIARGRNRDQILLGAGNDKLDVNNHRNAGALFDGGAGDDLVNLSTAYRERSRARAWTITTGSGKVRLDGRAQGRFPGWERWSLEMEGETLDFRGSSAAEGLLITNTLTGTVDMGAGDDHFAIDPLSSKNSGMSVEGGYGRDRFTYENWVTDSPTVAATFDMVTGAVTVPARGTTITHTMSGFEDLEVVTFNMLVEITGDDGPNEIRVGSCAATVHAGGGNDTVVARRGFPAEDACGPGHAFDGGAGDDYLVGSAGDDTLVGGEGTDHADGLGGTDTCDAETRLNCEA